MFFQLLPRAALHAANGATSQALLDAGDLTVVSLPDRYDALLLHHLVCCGNFLNLVA
jgi:hypothetical protein